MENGVIGMLMRILINRYTKPVVRYIFLRTPTFLSTSAYSLIRTASNKRNPYFKQAFSTVASSGADGDYLEFGVYQGSSFIMAFELAKKYRLDSMRFFAFDSFQGLPASEGLFQKGDYHCSKEMFIKISQKGGLDLEKVRVVEGLYGNALTEAVKRDNCLTKAAIVHVDCDLYESTKDVLRFIEDLVQPGSILIFDDWHVFDDEETETGVDSYGEKKAFREWNLAEHFDEFYDSKWGKAFLMRDHP